ncbi:hypothetical protein TrRE_jg6833 [Triparma retinervis]|uniref:SPRY domain-containing protein n=1 Tax=Triparma retinervis TaxID=2557542 RepID=A0A9W6Z3E1_9STRA|nr:hypothetical protein TrRE_jg6833 [Triparma retinervis]
MGCCFSSSSTTTSDGTELVSLPSSSSPPVPIPSTHCIDCTCKYADGVNTLTSSLNTGTVNKDKKDKETEQTKNWSIAGLDFVLDQDKCYFELTLSSASPPLTVGMYRVPPGKQGRSSSGLQKALTLLSANKSPINMESSGCYASTFTADELKKGDVVGCTVSFVDLPAVVFRVNGTVVGRNIHRVRGNVAPFVAWGGGEIRAAFEKRGWKEDSRGGDGVVRATNLI